VNSTRSPSFDSVALCQNAKLVSSMLARTFGRVGLRMSRITPSPVQAPAARSFSGYTVMSWQPVVGRSVPAVPSWQPVVGRSVPAVPSWQPVVGRSVPAVPSWQPVVGRSVPAVPSLPPSGNSTGSAITRAFAGLRFGIETIEILSWSPSQR
jgi:hypothetical protein